MLSPEWIIAWAMVVIAGVSVGWLFTSMRCEILSLREYRESMARQEKEYLRVLRQWQEDHRPKVEPSHTRTAEDWAARLAPDTVMPLQRDSVMAGTLADEVVKRAQARYAELASKPPKPSPKKKRKKRVKPALPDAPNLQQKDDDIRHFVPKGNA